MLKWYKMNAITAFIFHPFLINYQDNCDLGKYPMKTSRPIVKKQTKNKQTPKHINKHTLIYE